MALGFTPRREPIERSTYRFARPDAAAIAKRLRLAERGAVAARSEQRDADADSVELEIRAEIERLYTAGLADYEGQLAISERRLQSAGLDATVAVRIEQEASRGGVEFRTFGEDQCRNIGRLAERAERLDAELRRFVEDHRLGDRVPIVIPRAAFAKGVALLFLLWLVESAANAFFFAEGSTAGLVGGFVLAGGLSFINLALATAFAGVTLPNSGHRRWAQRLVLGFTGSTALLAALVVVNLVIAHFRDAFAKAQGAPVDFRVVLDGVAASPFALATAESWMLFLFGLILATLAIWKVSTLRDPYPGFGAIASRCEAAHDALADGRSEALEDLQNAHDRASTKLREELERLTHVQEERRLSERSRESLHREFVAFLGALQSCYAYLMTRYREAAAKTSAVPSWLDLTAPAPPLPAPEIDGRALEQATTSMRTAIADLDRQHAEHAHSLHSSPGVSRGP